MTTPKLLAFAGSAKETSVNRRALAVAAEGAREAGATVTVIDLRDYPLPIMDEDLEAAGGQPENAGRLQTLFGGHDGLLLACPEYNSSITPLLKNTIDWVSRPDADGTGLRYYKGKTAGLIGASPGGLGGLRGLTHVRAILSNLGMIVIPNQIAVSGAPKIFDDAGRVTDEDQKKKIRAVGVALAEVTAKLMALRP